MADRKLQIGGSLPAPAYFRHVEFEICWELVIDKPEQILI
jgi:hypothetical protein